MAKMAVIVPRWIVYVSRVQPTFSDKLPKYDNWKIENRLTVLDIMISTSFAGQSYAKIALTTGLPATPQIDIEFADTVLWHGDRVALGLDRGNGNIDWQFCGYSVQNNLSINDKAERRIYRIVGPEWIWGASDSAGSGAAKIVSGQARRLFAADETWRKTAGQTKYNGWKVFDDVKTMFNVDGKKDMTRDQVVLSPPGKKRITGYIWENHDLQLDGISAASHWNMLEACKTLVHVFGELEFSAIAPPDWSKVIMSADDKMRETSVEGIGVYEALRRVLGNKYGFKIWPVPMNEKGNPVPIQGNSWGPFQLTFFSRITGAPVNFVLNRRDTPMVAATASVKRLEAVRDVSKSVNKVTVQGSYVRPLKLIYWGGATPTITGVKKQIALQHSWKKADGSLLDYASHDNEITDVFADITAAKRQEWLDKFTTSGPQFQQNWKTFRKLTWNESGDVRDADEAQYYKLGAGLTFNPFSPDLTGIADTPEQPGVWYRRRRRLLDTLYLVDANRSTWEKHPPTLYMAIAKQYNNVNYATWKWKKCASSHYKVSTDEAAITFTAEDLAEWKPFTKQDADEEDASVKWPEDDRTFATLMLNGVLRLCLECAINCDFALPAISPVSLTSGAPIRREVVIDGTKNYIKTLLFDDGFTPPPSGLTPTAIDGRAEAKRQADITRESAEDEQIHCSLLASGDWPRQQLGGQIKEIQGRKIDMSSTSGRGAQIVAVRIDPGSFMYEYLTETLALAITAKDRRLIQRGQVFNARKATSIPNA